MTHLPSDFERSLLDYEPDFQSCSEVEDFIVRIADTLPYQLGLTLECIRERTGLRAEDISIIDGVALRVIVTQCVQQLNRQFREKIRFDNGIDVPFEAAERWLDQRFGADTHTLMVMCGGDRDLCREYLRRKMSDAEKV